MGKQSQKTTQGTTQNVSYKNTTTSNPYATATTNNGGTSAAFRQGNALDVIYNFVNNNISSVLDEYLNPTLNSVTNQAKLNAFANTVNSQAKNTLENNIINPLSDRNMVRSSQATDLYKNLSDTATSAFADYANELLAASQNDTASVLNNLLASYMQGYNVISDMQNQSLATSSGNANKTSASAQTSSTSGSDLGTLFGNFLRAYTGSSNL